MRNANLFFRLDVLIGKTLTLYVNIMGQLPIQAFFKLNWKKKKNSVYRKSRFYSDHLFSITYLVSFSILDHMNGCTKFAKPVLINIWILCHQIPIFCNHSSCFCNLQRKRELSKTSFQHNCIVMLKEISSYACLGDLVFISIASQSK